MGAVGWRVRWRLPALRGDVARGLHGGCADAYPPYGVTLREVCMAGALMLTRPVMMRLMLISVGWVSAAHPP